MVFLLRVLSLQVVCMQSKGCTKCKNMENAALVVLLQMPPSKHTENEVTDWQGFFKNHPNAESLLLLLVEICLRKAFYSPERGQGFS